MAAQRAELANLNEEKARLTALKDQLMHMREGDAQADEDDEEQALEMGMDEAESSASSFRGTLHTCFLVVSVHFSGPCFIYFSVEGISACTPIRFY